jgi:hypothetical protein
MCDSTGASGAGVTASAAAAAAASGGAASGGGGGRSSGVEPSAVALAAAGDADGGGTGPVVRESPSGGVFLEGAAVRPVSSARDILAVLAEGSTR